MNNMTSLNHLDLKLSVDLFIIKCFLLNLPEAATGILGLDPEPTSINWGFFH